MVFPVLALGGGSLAMKLIVGLGNPGKKYQQTRHNVGYEVLAELGRRHGDGKPRSKFQAEVMEAQVGSQKLLLLSPLTYMNLSGNSVQPARDFFKLSNSDLLIVCDDFNLPLAKLRFRTKGSAGGQKGLANILQRLGTQEVSRLRVGIGPPPENWDVADYVLSRFSEDERHAMNQTVPQAADVVADWVLDGPESCMNRYN
jgi:PTH1 family peptidyl-tRNA hydrolase